MLSDAFGEMPYHAGLAVTVFWRLYDIRLWKENLTISWSHGSRPEEILEC